MHNLILKNDIKKVYEDKVFTNCKSIHDVCKAIEKHRKQFGIEFENLLGHKPTGKMAKLIESHSDSYAGSLFEIFVVGLLILRGKYEKKLLISDVRCADIVGADAGIDVYGKTVDETLISHNRLNVNVQIKYSSKKTHMYSYRDLATFVAAAKKDNDDTAKYFSNMVFVTSGGGINHTAKREYREKSFNGNRSELTVINYKDLELMLQKPGTFFSDFNDLIKKSADYANSLINSDKEVTNREFQEKAIENILKELADFGKATAIMPTGSGKTVCAAKLVDELMKDKVDGGIVAIQAPTIALTSQCSNYNRQFFGNTYDYIRICSDPDRDLNSVNEKITLSPDEIKIQIISAILRKRKLMCIVTYKSYKKLYECVKDLGLTVDVGIFDEAHNIVHGGGIEGSDYNWKTKLWINENKLCDNEIYFTATPSIDESIVDDEGKIYPSVNFPEKRKNAATMNNIFQFGKFTVVSTELVENLGYILPTKLCFIDTRSKIPHIDSKIIQHIITEVCDEMDSQNPAKTVIRPTVDEIFTTLYIMDFLYKETKKYNKNNKVKIVYPAAGTLVAHALNKILSATLKKIDVKTGIFSEYIYVDSMSSDLNQMEIYSNEGTRENIISRMEENNHCIVTHYDMLSEGINIPSITAIILGRHMGATKAIQTNGRAIRPCERDLKLINKAHSEGDIYRYSPQNKIYRESVMHKPYAYFFVQVSGSDAEIINRIDSYFKIYNGTLEFVTGSVSYRAPAGAIDETKSDMTNIEHIKKAIAGNISEIPDYVFEQKEYSTYFCDNTVSPLVTTVEIDIDDQIEDEEEVISNTKINFSDIKNQIIKDYSAEILMNNDGVEVDPEKYGILNVCDIVELLNEFSGLKIFISMFTKNEKNMLKLVLKGDGGK